MRYEYKVVPAPKKGLKGKDVKGAEARFANALESAVNEWAAFGWQFVRADTLPFEERQGLTGRTTSYQTLLVFCRPVSGEAEAAPETTSQLPHLRAAAPAEAYTELAPREPAPDPRREQDEAMALRAHRPEADSAAHRRPVAAPDVSPQADDPARGGPRLSHARHSLSGVGRD